MSRNAELTCPACKAKLPHIWSDGVPLPQRGEVLDCGMCPASFRYGPPHSLVARMRVYTQADGTLVLRLTRGKTALDWAVTFERGREFVAAVLEAIEQAEKPEEERGACQLK